MSCSKFRFALIGSCPSAQRHGMVSSNVNLKISLGSPAERANLEDINPYDSNKRVFQGYGLMTMSREESPYGRISYQQRVVSDICSEIGGGLCILSHTLLSLLWYSDDPERHVGTPRYWASSKPKSTTTLCTWNVCLLRSECTANWLYIVVRYPLYPTGCTWLWI